MSFRTKLFLIFLVTVLASVSVVAYGVTYYTRAAFEERETQLTEALIAQFNNYFEQRAAFVGHEIEGRSFRELAAGAGITVNAMVLRKHHAVLYLRRRLQAIHDEFLGE